jgi:hypothetical protein
MMKKKRFHRAAKLKPLERLRYHVTGAIERGETEAIVEHATDIPAFLQISKERRKEAWKEFDAKRGVKRGR